MNEVTAQPATRRDLAQRGLEALDPQKAGASLITAAAGGVAFASALEVMEFAKLMAVADKAVPRHLRNNPGACLRIVFQAVEWRMSPWSVADKSYEVNDRIAYESQLIHAVIEARAPLQKRLNCEYDGEGPTRTCTVIGHFTDGETREYTTPMHKDIRVKNSPLWKDDPDQQLFYYASRSWARKWCPDVLMGIYSREELAENPRLGRDDDPIAVGLHQRLAGSTTQTGEGHREGFAAAELENLATNGGVVIDASAKAETLADAKAAEREASASPRGKRAADAAAKPKAERSESEPEKPKTVKEYIDYATAWIKATPDAGERTKRFSAEKKMRNGLGVTADDRAPLDELLAKMSAEEFDARGGE